ncbi:MAG: ATP-dependent DNA helicase RecG [Rickettsiales bacterium]|jgi:ATP-dependent DNA helicase RecG|nr:ATP-dependent DNA helicase RecG [Rickettsiales bacterium]
MTEAIFKKIAFAGKTAGAMRRLIPGGRAIDALLHFPTHFIDRTYSPTLADLTPGRMATVRAKVEKITPGARRAPTKVLCSDGTGKITLLFFNFPAYMKALLAPGREIALSGRAEGSGAAKTMSHPDYILPAAQIDDIRIVEPVYPLTYGVSNRTARREIAALIRRMPEVPEWRENPTISFAEAVRRMHAGEDGKARERIAYDEALANQLALAMARAGRGRGAKITGDGGIVCAILSRFGHPMTKAQERSWREIEADLAGEDKMNRLLQGDVGSGKTLVAALALARTVEAGMQGALMCPTEILAAQHFETLLRLCGDTAHIALLTGRDKAGERREKLKRFAAGEIDIAVGTHALQESGVEFRRLGLAVIDEQHKFGVEQRARMAQKCGFEEANILMTTATPIPRTLALANYGDMDISAIDEPPPGRVPAETAVMSMAKIGDVAANLKLRIDSGGGTKAYWVCPLIDESEKLALSAVMKRYESLRETFGDRVALVHGKMTGAETDAAIADFANKDGKAKILLATTVIEVGVNVPEANVMVIEHAEHFGLAQLHQLRGRIGRGGGGRSFCILLAAPAGETARARLEAMKSTSDGFEIAEMDLKLRGAGDMAGTKQSGLAALRFGADTIPGMIEAANEEARRTALRGIGAAHKILMEIFGYGGGRTAA